MAGTGKVLGIAVMGLSFLCIIFLAASLGTSTMQWSLSVGNVEVVWGLQPVKKWSCMGDGCLSEAEDKLNEDLPSCYKNKLNGIAAFDFLGMMGGVVAIVGGFLTMSKGGRFPAVLMLAGVAALAFCAMVAMAVAVNLYTAKCGDAAAFKEFPNAKYGASFGLIVTSFVFGLISTGCSVLTLSKSGEQSGAYAAM